jgi:vacuolar protein sorting-associated protein 72
MPLVKDDDDEDETSSEPQVKKQSRNFIIFPDEQTLRQAFPVNRAPKVVDVSKKFCAVTGQPAKYYDPVTQKPYANLYAFQALREMHNKKATPQNTQN